MKKSKGHSYEMHCKQFQVGLMQYQKNSYSKCAHHMYQCDYIMNLNTSRGGSDLKLCYDFFTNVSE